MKTRTVESRRFIRCAVSMTVSFVIAAMGAEDASAQTPPPKGRYTFEQYSIGGSPRLLAPGDFDHDGRIDVVATHFDEGRIGIVRNVGFSRFTAGGVQTIGSSPAGMRLGDFDGDGNLDVLVRRASANAAYVTRGDGTAQLLAPIALPTPSAAGAIGAADLDGDGDAEALVASGTPGLGIAHWTGSGFGPVSFIPVVGPQALEFADVDGDGFVDVVIPDGFLKQLLVLRGDGMGGLSPSFVIPITTAPGRVLPRDVQGDGIIDLVTKVSASLGETTAIETRLGTGAGSFAPPITSTALNGFVDLGDVDLDGDLDLLSGTLQLTGLSEMISAGTFAAPVTFDCAGAFQWDGMFADVDADGWPDVVTTLSELDAIGVLPGTGNFDYSLHSVVEPPLSTGTNAAYVVYADANADGELDLVSASSVTSPNLSTRLADGTGNFGPPVVTPLPAALNSLRVTDFDVDGWDDILSKYVTSNTQGLAALRGTGQTQFVLAGLHAVKPTSTNYAIGAFDVGDVDLDGDQDVVLGGFSVPEVGVMVHTGFGVFAPAVFSPNVSAFGVTSTSLEDLDGDGVLDLAIVQSTNPISQVHLLKGSTNGQFALVTSLVTPGPCGYAAFANLNADGKPDLLAWSRSANPGAVMSFVGGMPFQFGSSTTHVVTPGVGPSSHVITDIDHDGFDDLLIAGTGFGRIAFSQSDGNGGLRPPRSFVTPSGMTPVAVHDLDDDGRPELTIGSTSNAGIWILRGQLEGDASAYGLGCAGSGGITPELWVQGTPTLGESLTVRVRRGLGGAVGLLVFGGAPAALPIGGTSCSLLTSPLFPVVLTVPLAGSGAGLGEMAFVATVPAGTPEAVFGMQVLVADPGGAGGISATNAVSVAIQQ